MSNFEKDRAIGTPTLPLPGPAQPSSDQVFDEYPETYEVPVWTEDDGRKWEIEPLHEQCEHAEGCLEPTYYVGRLGESQTQLCAHHFEQLVRNKCTLTFETYC
jgi:hypothetical protein